MKFNINKYWEVVTSEQQAALGGTAHVVLARDLLPSKGCFT